MNTAKVVREYLQKRLRERMMRFTREVPAPEGSGLRATCKIWTGCTNGHPDNPYGKITVRIPGRKNPVGVSTHKLSYETHVKKVPEGWDTGHKCHRSLCWEPTHLKAITKAANQREKGTRKW